MYFLFLPNKETRIYRAYLLKITKMPVKSRVLLYLCSSKPVLPIHLTVASRFLSG